jgi:hypothetical protein
VADSAYITIRAQAETIIAATTPHDNAEPVITFRAAPYNGPLEALPLEAPRQVTRTFHVVGANFIDGAPEWGGELAKYHHHFLVRIRYWIPFESGGYLRFDKLSQADSVRILHTLLRPPTTSNWGSTPQRGIELVRRTIEHVRNDLYILELEFRSLYGQED